MYFTELFRKKKDLILPLKMSFANGMMLSNAIFSSVSGLFLKSIHKIYIYEYSLRKPLNFELVDAFGDVVYGVGHVFGEVVQVLGCFLSYLSC